MNSEPVIQELRRLFETRGAEQYSGEAVSQLEHALQAGALAERDGAADALVVASLLHDVGHLLHDLPEDCAEDGVDDHHEGLGSRWLAQHFVAAVAEPVRLHVAAKRYRVATEADYFARLSPTSVRSLELQGGPMNDVERAAFEASPFATDAVRLRGYDEEAKVEGAATPSFEHFEPRIRACLRGAT